MPGRGHHECYIWTDERVQWIKDHKGIPLAECYEGYKKNFPDHNPSYSMFRYKRLELGAGNGTPSKVARPLYSEYEKKGYFYIKIAQPNVWVSKARWVYMETHPDEVEDITDKDEFVFLDGDKRNFDPSNICVLHPSERTMFANFGGTEKDNPEVTYTRILLARMKVAMLDMAERNGMITKKNGWRQFKK